MLKPSVSAREERENRIQLDAQAKVAKCQPDIDKERQNAARCLKDMIPRPLSAVCKLVTCYCRLIASLAALA